MKFHALAGAIALALLAAPAAKAVPAIPYPSRAAERFSVEVRGRGPDIILIPGLTSSRAVYEKTSASSKAASGFTWCRWRVSAASRPAPTPRARCWSLWSRPCTPTSATTT